MIFFSSKTRERILLLSIALAVWSAPASAQYVDRSLSAAIGGSLGDLVGIVGALPAGCGGVFSDRVCRLSPLAVGFGVGNVLGSALGGADLRQSSSCSPAERLGRSLSGSLIGAGLGVAAVSRTHGNLRIGLSPLVQVAEAGAAAAMLQPCKRLNSTALDSSTLNLRGKCNVASEEMTRDAAVAGMAGGYAALHVYLNREWWSTNPAKKWFVVNDWDQNERDADKFGHFLGGYHLARVTSELLQAGCVSGSRAVIAGALYAWAFQFQIEEWDGTQQIYGFNPSDLIADAAGAFLVVAQEHNPSLRYIKPTFMYRPTLAFHRRNDPGHSGQPRATTDYAGQSYWFSTDVHSMLPDRMSRWWPAFVRLSPGYSITDYVDPETGASHRAKRKILLSLDLDPEKLPGDNKVWRLAKHELSYLHIPGPTIQFTPDAKFFLPF